MNSKRKLAAIINRRKSGRAYAKKSLSKATVLNCLEAARWAPSSSNSQPWRFIILDKKSPKRKLLEATLSRGNAWAKAAPVLVVVCANKKDDPSYENTDYFEYDTGMAMMSFVLQAQYEGLRCHQMGGFDHKAVKKALKVPVSSSVFAVMAMGYPGKLSDLDDRTRAKERKPRTRQALKDMAFKDMYGKAYK